MYVGRRQKFALSFGRVDRYLTLPLRCEWYAVSNIIIVHYVTYVNVVNATYRRSCDVTLMCLSRWNHNYKRM